MKESLSLYLMIKTIFFLFFFSSVTSFSQGEIFSFYFSEKSVNALNKAEQLESRYFGKYELTDDEQYEVRKSAGEFLILDETGIYIEKNRISHISREEVRENSTYNVRKGWLHGVVENDSIPCALDGENYYFLVPVKTYLYEKKVPTTQLVLFSAGVYGLFYREEGDHFSAIVLSVKNNGLQLKNIEFSLEGEQGISNIEKKEKVKKAEKDFDTYLLSPTKEEWNKFILSHCLQAYDAYVKEAVEK
ncbi:MAG: hypothetical protein WDZ35_00350 [Crocinitomicaceae bacterium]